MSGLKPPTYNLSLFWLIFLKDTPCNAVIFA